MTPGQAHHFFTDKTTMSNPSNIYGFDMDTISRNETPFYYYNMDVLSATLNEIKRQTAQAPFMVHYAVKANGNPLMLNEIAKSGLGADLVSGGEVIAAVNAGFKPAEMTFSGVGKTDKEINVALEKGVGCFNVESIPELEVINQLAAAMGKKANFAIRVNPDIDAHTHKYITTGTADNKFGINIEMLESVINCAQALSNIHLMGLHFHIGSQITTMQPYTLLCDTINSLQEQYENKGVNFEMINVGGGLGIDYNNPDDNPLPDFEAYFNTFKNRLMIRPGQRVHFELGRAIVGECGSLIARVVFVKENRNKKFAILDAGMTDLIRPALYNAHHKIQNLTSNADNVEPYDIVGPVCESSDVFASDYPLPLTRRGDLIAIRSAGAYGESMSSTYNMRPLPHSVFAWPQKG